MGVLDDAIREHLDLKKRRGASDEEIARAEAEALGPARRGAPGPDADRPNATDPDDLLALEDEHAPDDEHEDAGFTHARHDIDEDPMPAPSRSQDESTVDQGTVESDVLREFGDDEPPDASGRLSE
jgi:hypothetical protein